ncbi:FAD binding domain-containing protein [Lipomyces oligophaga]|uniref:FAD binding domain-containing protein n=1 Tax=Lipomyces oligophaga TaxID=45792 RepID=UPI0034CEE6EE
MVAQESNVDVLIIGAGPAGLMTANWMARAGINARIIDKRSSKIFAGQADGLECRTLEVFRSFGIDGPWNSSNHMQEVCFWEPDGKGGLYRSARIPDTVKGISRFQQCVIHQGRIESWFIESIEKTSRGKITVERGMLPVSIEIDESKISEASAYPVSVLIKKLDEDTALPDQYGGKVANGLFRAFEGDQEKYYSSVEPTETDSSFELVHAKYVVGCDGAHSWVRKQLGIEMEGESTDYVWGVLDAVPLTDFPDIRHRCAIHSADSGSIMVIPREHGVVRFYIQLQETPRDPETQTESEKSSSSASAKSSGRVDRSRITPEFILAAAQKIFYPYKIDIRDVRWYTAYQIGQRVSPTWHKQLRVFIAGDACHTHSPKAGQGMNTSMMDTFNLGWKLAHVCNGLARSDILETYEDERKKNAYDLINFDYKLSRLFSGKPAVLKDSESEQASSVGSARISLQEFRRVFEMGKAFASGCIIDYPSSLLEYKPKEIATEVVDPEGGTALVTKYISPIATNVPVGMRFDTAQVVSQSEANPHFLSDLMPSDGRWRIVYFAGDFKDNMALTDTMTDIAAYLDSKDSLIKRFTPQGAKSDSVIEIILIHASPRTAVEWTEFPQAFRPKDNYGREDFWKIYVDDESHHNGHGHAYKKYGIDPKKGALIVVRPDGYVSAVLPIGADSLAGPVAEFFNKFMIDVSTRKADPFERWDLYGSDEVVQPVLAL